MMQWEEAQSKEPSEMSHLDRRKDSGNYRNQSQLRGDQIDFGGKPAGVARSRKFGLVTWSGSHLVKSIGMVLRRPRP